MTIRHFLIDRSKSTIVTVNVIVMDNEHPTGTDSPGNLRIEVVLKTRFNALTSVIAIVIFQADETGACPLTTLRYWFVPDFIGTLPGLTVSSRAHLVQFEPVTVETW